MRAACHATAALVLSLFFPLTNWAASYRVLHTFTGGSDGGAPASSLVLDGSGNLYGTAYSGGKGAHCPYQSGCGVLFELSPQANGRWKEGVLFNFVTATGGASTQPLASRGRRGCVRGHVRCRAGQPCLYVRANARRRLEFQPDLRLRRSLPGLRPNGRPIRVHRPR